MQSVRGKLREGGGGGGGGIPGLIPRRMASGGEGDTHFVVERRGRGEGFDKLLLKMSFLKGSKEYTSI